MSGTPTQALKPGTRIESFEIKDVLGAGGFGITYKAWDHQLQCDVAIKEYLPGDLATRGEDQVTVTVLEQTEELTEGFHTGLEKFLEEARILARFKDPNLVSVKQFISVHGTAYMVMDYEQGNSLAQYLRANPPPVSPEMLERLATRLLRALTTVHDSRILHRDIKPGNIYLREDGDPVLIDFGSARERVYEKRGQELTSMVTLGYAPHEQYHRRGNQGPWTDLYALAATLYFCTTGTKPADGMERYLAMQDGGPDPLLPCSRLAAGMYDARLLAAIDWMLQVTIERRPPSARAVLDVIEGLAESPAPESRDTATTGPDEATVLLERTEVIRERTPVTPAPAVRRPPLAALIAGGAAVLLLAGAGAAYVGAGRIEAGVSQSLAEAASRVLNTPVTLGPVHYALLANEVHIDRFEIGNPPGYAPGAMLSARLVLAPEGRWWWAGEQTVFRRVEARDVKARIELSENREHANIRDFLNELQPPAAADAELPRASVRELSLGELQLTLPPVATGKEAQSLVLDGIELAHVDSRQATGAAELIVGAVQAFLGAANRQIDERRMLATASRRSAPVTRAAPGNGAGNTKPAAPAKPAAEPASPKRSVIDWLKRKFDEPPNREVFPGD